MRTFSKGASEKRRLTQHVTNTVLDDNLKGTTEQFVLHFNEQFRQLDEISDDSEKLPPTVKLALVGALNVLHLMHLYGEVQHHFVVLEKALGTQETLTSLWDIKGGNC